MRKKAYALFFVVLTASVAQVFADFAYVINSNDVTVSVIDTTSNTVVATITGFNGPAGIVASPNGQYVYVANYNPGTVSVIDTNSHTIVVLTITVGSQPSGSMGFTPNGQYVYVANYNSGSASAVSVINTTTYTVIATITVGAGPSGAAVTPDGLYAYVINSDSTASVIDTGSNTVVTVITGFDGPDALAITPNGEYVYVSNNNTGINVITTSSNTITATITAGLSAPQSVVITPNGEYAYVSNFGTNDVNEISTSLYEVTGTITGFTNPQQSAVTSDGLYLYVPNSVGNPSDPVNVIETSSNTVVDTILVGSEPYAIAIISAPASPTNLTGKQRKNDFGLIYELYNFLQWDASSSATTVGYFVYRNGVKIATLNARTLKYKDHDRRRGEVYFYEVTAFNALGTESSSVAIEIP